MCLEAAALHRAGLDRISSVLTRFHSPLLGGLGGHGLWVLRGNKEHAKHTSRRKYIPFLLLVLQVIGKFTSSTNWLTAPVTITFHTNKGRTAA